MKRGTLNHNRINHKKHSESNTNYEKKPKHSEINTKYVLDKNTLLGVLKNLEKLSTRSNPIVFKMLTETTK